MLLHVLGAVGVSSAAVLTYALLLVVHPTHFLQAQYAIPVLVSVAVRALICLPVVLSSYACLLDLGPTLHSQRGFTPGGGSFESPVLLGNSLTT